VYLRAYPGAGPAIQVSTGGGAEPAWSHDGSEIFYREHDRMMAVPFGPAQTPVPGRPRMIFEQPYLASGLGVADYDVASDGRFVMIRPVNIVREAALSVVLNWTEDLKRLLPPR
jgi:hypothetical protein